MRAYFFLIILLLSVTPTLAQDVTVRDVWARSTRGAVGAAYLTLQNHGAAPVDIVKVTTSAAGRVELHDHIHGDDGVMRMRPVEKITAAPNSSVSLEPGGLHIMLFDLKAPLEAGQTLPLTLHFAQGFVLKAEAAIK